ncbi:uncharacterized protein LOC123866612 [Maniola jurtina]|uniref:uncharacterized protein LOC123866612 n=1 Tax=Maniola jurtina TaxID=191418 RepID=UPI001E68BDE5|nr:uncharacterized protein LOC123866612 [Maniola jurtina]
MWVHTLLVSIGVVSIAAIKIPLQPLENTHTITKRVPIREEQIQSLPIYYVSDDNVDSYLIPPDPHKPEEVIRDAVPTPATYLLPPSPDKQNEYFANPAEPGEQTEWYPIAATNAKQQDAPLTPQDIQLNPNEARANLRTGKILHRGQVITVPSRNLLPPIENAQDDYVIISPSAELELPLEEIDHTQNQKVNIKLPILRPPLKKPHPVFRISPEPLPVAYITPPGNPQEYKNPTRLYPKKYINEFKPIPIPISQYQEESEDDISTINPQSEDIHHNSEHLTPTKEKQNYFYEETQKKRKQQKEAAKPAAASGDTYEEENNTEQDVSESNHRHHGNHIHPTHPRKEQRKHKSEPKSKGERTEFRMHGMKGPHSYQFGYDTGKGKNRQFRYEERDNDGHVRGHYGYVDKFGKLRVVNYDADPELGFRAEAPVVTD